MKRWEKLEQAFKLHIESMSEEDWDNWFSNTEKLSQERFEQAKIRSEKHSLNYKELKTKFTETLIVLVKRNWLILQTRYLWNNTNKYLLT